MIERLDGASLFFGFSTIFVMENALPLRSPTPTMPYMWTRSSGTSSTAMILALASKTLAASIICLRQPGLFCTSTSGSSSANGSLPTSSRAHHTAWPSPSGDCWRVKLAVPASGRSSDKQFQFRLLAALDQREFQLELAVEMVLDHALVAAGDEDAVLDAGFARLVDHVLDQRAVDHRQHFLRHGLGGRQKAGSEAGDGKMALRIWVMRGWASLAGGAEHLTKHGNALRVQTGWRH